MANDTPMTFIGNLTADPELKQVGPNQTLVLNFTLANTPSRFNRATNQWEEQESTFMSVKAFKDLAQHAASSLRKGMRVVVTGNLTTERWDEKDQNGNLTGNKREKYVIVADDVSVSLRYGTAAFQRTAQNAQGAAPVAQQAQSPNAQPVMPQGQQQFQQPQQQFQGQPQGQPQGQAPQQFQQQQAPQAQPVQNQQPAQPVQQQGQPQPQMATAAAGQQQATGQMPTADLSFEF